MPWIPQPEEQGEESQEAKRWTQGQCPMEDTYREEDIPHAEGSFKDEDKGQVALEEM